MKINNRLKELRLNKKLSQEELAIELSKYGIKADKFMISKWERGVYSPSTETGTAYAKFFNVSYDYLLGLTDSNVIKEPITNQHNIDLSILSEDQLQRLEMILATNNVMFFNGNKGIDEAAAEELKQSITEVFIHHLKETGQL